MLTGSIRRLMITIAGIAVLCAGGVWLSRLEQPHRETHQAPNCGRNLRNTLLAILQYESIHDEFPPGTLPNSSLPPEKRLCLHAATIAYIDRQEESNLLHLDQAWDSPSNVAVAGISVPELRCRQQAPVSSGVPAPTAFIGIAGLGTDAPFLPKGHPRAGVFGYDRRTTSSDFRDGRAFTMVLAESPRLRGCWLAGGSATVRGLDTADLPYIGTDRQFGLTHSIGTFAAFADGSVRYLSEKTDPRIFEALSTLAGHEDVSPDSLVGE